MHGGISDRITSLEQLSHLERPRTEPPLRTLEIDLLWADPMRGLRGVQPNPRGAGIMFGEDLIERIRALLGIDYIIRAHQVGLVPFEIAFTHFSPFQLVPNGVEYFAGRQLITVFSAPRYSNSTNTGATLMIAKDLSHTITRFPPA